MPLTTGQEFTSVLNWDGVGTASSDYTDVTLEAQSPAGTSFTIFNTAAHYLYLGHSEKFDMAVFDLDSTGSLGALTWEYSTSGGSGWTEFIPGSGRFQIDPDDSEGTQYGFTQDGIEMFPINLLSGWVTSAINSSTKYWVRATAASVANAPTVKRIQMRAYNSYCTTNEVFRLFQLNNVLGGTDFSATSIPSKASVEDVRNMTREEAKECYKQDFWNPAKVDRLPENLRHIYFDMVVNMGRKNAGKIIQQAVNTKKNQTLLEVDGIVGSGTLSHVTSLTLKDVLVERSMFFANNCFDGSRFAKRTRQNKFLRGWIFHRVFHFLTYPLEDKIEELEREIEELQS